MVDIKSISKSSALLLLSVKPRLFVVWFLIISIYLIAPLSAVELLNVSYDPTREFYNDFNSLFRNYWKTQKGEDISIRQSHGGSGKQARSIIDGLEADVATLALGDDLDVIASKKLINSQWQSRLPENSAPYTSTVVFLVRRGNPKKISGWADLIRPGVRVITPNPKTSGGARWNHLAAWGYALKANNNNPVKACEFMSQLYNNVPLLTTGARAATAAFVERGMGDVLITWENEAFLILNQMGQNKFERVTPSMSILAEPPVSIVDSVVDRRGTRAVAEAYLRYLYTPEAQEIAARHGFRPRNSEVAAKYASAFPKLDLFTMESIVGSWARARQEHFAEGALVDQITHSGLD